MSILVKCNIGCDEKFIVHNFEHEMLDGIEKTYFVCPHCDREYVITYTNKNIKNYQSKYRALGRECSKRPDKMTIYVEQMKSLSDKIEKEIKILKNQAKEKVNDENGITESN